MEVKYETIKRISGLYHYIDNGISISKTNMNGFIKMAKNNDITTFTGVALDIEGKDKYVIDNILNNIQDAYYIRGIIDGKTLKLTTLSNKNNPIDYKLIRVGLNDYYGSCFEIDFKTNYEQIDKMILSYKSSMKDFSKITITDLDANEDYTSMTFGNSMYKLHKSRLNINAFLINLMGKEETYTIGEAFENRGMKLSKTLFNKKEN